LVEVFFHYPRRPFVKFYFKRFNASLKLANLFLALRSYVPLLLFDNLDIVLILLKVVLFA